MHCKVLLLADINSTHTRKWAWSLYNKGITVKIFSTSSIQKERFSREELTAIAEFYIPKRFEAPFTVNTHYYQAITQVKKSIVSFKPDIVHAHYATSYGLLGALSKFHPFVLSLWGSDVFDFPNKSILHKKLLKNNLEQADKVLSTSNIMASEVGKYTNKNVTVTPFGVDTTIFKPMPNSRSSVMGIDYKEGDIIVGTIKAMEEKYGINYLMEAFAVVKKRYPDKPLKLLIVGDGAKINELKLLAKTLGIEALVQFTGFILSKEVPLYHNIIDIAVYSSTKDSESFGVAALEASACGNAVIASNIGGLPEVVEDNVTGILVPPANVEQLAKAIETLVLNSELRKQYGNNGRNRAEKLYEWDKCVAQMINIYGEILKKEQNPLRIA